MDKKELETCFREGVVRGLKLGRVDRSKPQSSFLKFFNSFRTAHMAEEFGSRENILKWRVVFFEVLARTEPKPVPPARGQLRVLRGGRLCAGAAAAERRHKAVLGNDF